MLTILLGLALAGVLLLSFVLVLFLLHKLAPATDIIDQAIEEQIASEHRLARHKVHFRWQQRETAIIQRVERKIGKRADQQLRDKVVQRFRETHG